MILYQYYAFCRRMLHVFNIFLSALDWFAPMCTLRSAEWGLNDLPGLELDENISPYPHFSSWRFYDSGRSQPLSYSTNLLSVYSRFFATGHNQLFGWRNRNGAGNRNFYTGLSTQSLVGCPRINGTVSPYPYHRCLQGLSGDRKSFSRLDSSAHSICLHRLGMVRRRKSQTLNKKGSTAT